MIFLYVKVNIMKLWSKEALVLGGIYGVLSTPCVYLNLENIGYCLFFVFIACMLGICFNKVPKFINELINNYPKTAYYLASIGWIPYFAIISVVGFIGLGYFIEYSDSTVQILMKLYVWILNLGVPVSLVVAFIWQKFSRG